MSIKKNTYTIYEGKFLTQSPDFDHSVNVLRYRGEDEAEYSILINRAWLLEDQTLEEFCEKQMEFMSNTIPGFQVEGKQLKHELGPAKLPVVQIANSFFQDGKPMKQVQSMVLLPYHPVINPGKINVIIFTLAVEGEFTEAQRRHYVQVINSFQPESVTE